MTKEIIFYYDVICPYAYLASKLITDVAKHNGAILRWRPVLLGGIYKSTKPEHVEFPDNKMILTYADQKRKVLARDLALQFARYNIRMNRFSIPDIRTLNALRLIASVESETSDIRKKLTETLFDALWQHEKDISDVNVLQEAADAVGYHVDVKTFIEDKTNPARKILSRNTDEAVQRGAFGVPSFWVNERLYFGGDRLFLVERALGNTTAQPHRLLSNQDVKKERKAKLTVYFDFSSPWSFIAVKQLPAFLSSLTNVSVIVEWVPVLVGALFNSIGTPTVPIRAMGDNKRNYMLTDLSDWLTYHGITNFKSSSHFPMRTTIPLRTVLTQPDYKLIDMLMDATWVHDQDVSIEEVVAQNLKKAGYNGKLLVENTKSDELKYQLRKCNERALLEGVCGVPSFQVNDGPIIFGQDRLNVVADLLLGWKPPVMSHLSKL